MGSTGTPDATGIERIPIQVDGGGGSPCTSPSVVFVDIVVTGSSLASGSWNFDGSSNVYTTSTASGPVGTIRLNDFPGDTNVSGAAISWVGP